MWIYIKEYFKEWGAFWLINILTIILGLLMRDDVWNWIYYGSN